MTDVQKPQWNIRGLIELLGGVQALRDRFMAQGFEPPPLQTMIGWRRRNSAPCEWALALLALAAADPALPVTHQLLSILKVRA